MSRQHRAEGARDRHPGNRSKYISTIRYDQYYKPWMARAPSPVGVLLDAAQVLSGPLRCHRFAARLESHTCDTLHPLSPAAAAGYNRRRWSLHQSFPIEATFTHRAAREWEQVRERHIVFPPWRLALTPFAHMPPCKSNRLRAASLSCVGTLRCRRAGSRPHTMSARAGS